MELLIPFASSLLVPKEPSHCPLQPCEQDRLANREEESSHPKTASSDCIRLHIHAQLSALPCKSPCCVIVNMTPKIQSRRWRKGFPCGRQGRQRGKSSRRRGREGKGEEGGGRDGGRGRAGRGTGGRDGEKHDKVVVDDDVEEKKRVGLGTSFKPLKELRGEREEDGEEEEEEEGQEEEEDDDDARDRSASFW